MRLRHGLPRRVGVEWAVSRRNKARSVCEPELNAFPASEKIGSVNALAVSVMFTLTFRIFTVGELTGGD